MKPLHDLAALLAALPPGEGVVLHSAAAHPTRLAGLLADAAPALPRRQVFCLMPCGPLPYAEAPAREALDLLTFLPGPGLRAALDAGRVQALRQPLSTVPGAFARGQWRAGAVLLRVSPPDAQGRVSLGVSVDYMPAAIAAARLVIAEIDPGMPQVAGAGWLPASRIDAFVASQDGPHEAGAARSDPVDQAIAGHVASLVEDGAVLQLGVGALPEQVLARLGHARHLGLHTGIIGDAVRPLIERGVIDNSTKARFAGTSIASMALGTRAFYGFLHRNPAFELHPCDVTHSGEVLRGVGRLVAINSALQVDLAGRVNAEWVGARRIAVPGGLPDFARAASELPRGRSIVALRALDRAGNSNLVPALAPQRPASLQGHEVDFVVTEFGVAALRGASARQRSLALAAVAAPQHREALLRASPAARAHSAMRAGSSRSYSVFTTR